MRSLSSVIDESITNEYVPALDVSNVGLIFIISLNLFNVYILQLSPEFESVNVIVIVPLILKVFSVNDLKCHLGSEAGTKKTIGVKGTLCAVILGSEYVEL